MINTVFSDHGWINQKVLERNPSFEDFCRTSRWRAVDCSFERRIRGFDCFYQQQQAKWSRLVQIRIQPRRNSVVWEVLVLPQHDQASYFFFNILYIRTILLPTHCSLLDPCYFMLNFQVWVWCWIRYPDHISENCSRNHIARIRREDSQDVPWRKDLSQWPFQAPLGQECPEIRNCPRFLSGIRSMVGSRNPGFNRKRNFETKVLNF